jgi:hypothetical protein
MATHRNMQLTDTILPISRGWSNLAKALVDIGRGLSRGLTSLGEQRLGTMPTPSRVGVQVPLRPSDLFAQALRDDSQLAMDWLWLCSQVSSVAEKRYCLDRALAINPHSEIARSERAKLPRSSTS